MYMKIEHQYSQMAIKEIIFFAVKLKQWNNSKFFWNSKNCSAVEIATVLCSSGKSSSFLCSSHRLHYHKCTGTDRSVKLLTSTAVSTPKLVKFPSLQSHTISVITGDILLLILFLTYLHLQVSYTDY